MTRGDHQEGIWNIAARLPDEWEHLIWDNGSQRLSKRHAHGEFSSEEYDVSNLAVYGRYAAIEYTDADLIYVQDDDVVVSDPKALVNEWLTTGDEWWDDPNEPARHVVCNMPPEFRHAFYEDHALVGFGAVFHRDAPQRAWDTFRHATAMNSEEDTAWVNRTCDIIFTALTPRVLVDVPVENLPYAYHYDRMYRQPQHMAERARMRELVLKVRDGEELTYADRHRGFGSNVRPRRQP